MKLTYLGIVLVGCFNASIALAGPAPSARVEPVHVRAVTDVADARACEPQEGGGAAVATGGGLVLVDARGEARVLTSLDGLPDTRVHAIARRGHVLWVGTEGGTAIVSLADEGARVVRTIGGAPVQAVHVMPDGTTYLGTRGEGVLRLRDASSPAEPVASAVSGTHVAAITDRDGALYVAYVDGPLAKLDAPSGVLRAVGGGPTHGESLAVVSGALVLGDLEGVYRVDGDGFVPIASVDARAMAAQGDTLLVASNGGGLEVGGARGALHEEAGVPRFARGVGALGAARCVATTEGAFLDPGSGTFHRLLESILPSNDVTALAVSPSRRIAIGTFEDGVVLRDGDRTKRAAGIATRERVSALAWDGDTLWVATARGAVRVSPEGEAHRFTSADGLPSTFVRAVAVVAPNRVLVGTDAGPVLVERDTVVPLEDPAPVHARSSRLASPMHATFAVGALADGTLLVGTNAGLYYGTRSTGFHRASLVTGEIPDDWITAIAVRGADAYVGTYANGVVRLRFPPAGGHPASTAFGGGYVNTNGLTLRGGELWAATMEGALVRGIATADGAPWRTEAGVSTGRDVTAIAFLGDETWVASRRGVAVVAGGEYGSAD